MDKPAVTASTAFPAIASDQTNPCAPRARRRHDDRAHDHLKLLFARAATLPAATAATRAARQRESVYADATARAAAANDPRNTCFSVTVPKNFKEPKFAHCSSSRITPPSTNATADTLEVVQTGFAWGTPKRACHGIIETALRVGRGRVNLTSSTRATPEDVVSGSIRRTALR